MRFREVAEADLMRIQEGVVAMHAARSLEETADALVTAAMDLVPCDHGGYSEVDLHFGRTRLFSSEPQVEDWVKQKLDVWQRFMPDHPVLRYRTENPDVGVVRLSDVVELPKFYGSGIYNELFREVDTNHQLVVHLGVDPRLGPDSGALPLTLGVPLNRRGRDFTRRDVEVMAVFQRLARPALRRKRAEHQLRLLDAAAFSPEIQRSLMALGLSARQAEVTFWILKGKSNTDIGTILDVGAQTVRQHSIAIFRRLGVGGRLTLQRTVIRALAGFD
jgi:DNA-binding CsgD family transcriptional regulator